MANETKTDAYLIGTYVRYTQGRAEAEKVFHELVSRHGGMVHQTCLRVLGDPVAAEDAAQATFMVLACKANTIHGNVGGFLHGVAVKVARLARKSERIRKDREKEAVAMREKRALAQMPSAVLWEDVWPHLDEALEALPDRQRSAVILHYLEGHTQQESAQAMGITRSSLDRYLRLAIEKLRAKLSRCGVGITGAVLVEFLSQRTVETACPAYLASAAGTLAAGSAAAVSGKVTFLTNGAIHMLHMAKLKVAAVVCVAVAGTATGAGVVTYKVMAEEKPPVRAEEGGAGVIYTKENAPKTPTLDELERRDSVSQHGITWTFDKKVPVGQFVTGNWYVVGPVTVTMIDPKLVMEKEVRNGSMLNPPPVLHASAFDSRLDRPNFFKRDLVAKLPISMKPGDALMSSIGMDQPKNGRAIKSFSILTCLKEPVPADAFRPGYCDRQQEIYLARNLKREKLLQLPIPKDAPDIKIFEAMFERPWHELSYLEDAQAVYQERYGRTVCEKTARATFLLHFDFKPEEKERLLVYFVQYGLDIWGIAKSANGSHVWITLGGWGSGRKWPVVFSGLLLGEEKLAYVNKTYPFFQEDEQTMYDDCWTGAGVVYAGHCGYVEITMGKKPYPPGCGPYEHTHPSRWVAWGGTSYRTNMTSSTWIGEALLIRIMHAEKEWGYDAFLDYCDRWMHEPDSGYRNPERGSTQGHSWEGFFEPLWKTYRENLPALPGAENAPRPPTGWKKTREMKSVGVEIKNGALAVQGKPFIPLMIFAEHPKRIDDAVAIGANTIAEGSFEQVQPAVGVSQCVNNRKFMDQLEEKGLYGVFGADMRVAGHPNLLGWIHLDEPDRVMELPVEKRGEALKSVLPSYRIMNQWLRDIPKVKSVFQYNDPDAQLSEDEFLITPVYHWFKKTDASRPVFMTVGPAFFKALGEGKKGICEAYLKDCDVVGCRVPGGEVGEAVAKLKKLSGRKPVFAWMETKEAKPEEIRTAVRAAIAKGATAIGYRGFEGLKDEKPDAAVMAELKKINAQITSHAAELIADPAKADDWLK